MYLLGIQQWIWEAINSIWFMLCDWIYSFISFMYQVFMKIASVNLFSTEIFKEITGRIYVVMGIAMLFIFAYNLVLMIINPEDKKGTGAMGKVVKETIISLVVVVLLPTIFNYMYIFQNHILESNVIGQIIMGGGINTGGRDPSNCNQDDFACKCDYTASLPYLNVNDPMDIVLSSLYNTNTPLTTMSQKLDVVCETYRGYKPLSNGKYITDSDRGAYSIAPLIFSSFYRPHFFSMEQCEDYLKTGNTSVLTMDKSQALCQRYYFHYYASVYTGDFGYFTADEITRDFIADPNDEHMEFNWPLAIVAGIMGLWMFICYTMEIGVRVAKLGVLQIISPIAVMMRIIPGQKEKIFDKWFKNLKDTYIDVFIRLAIIFFSLFAITLVPGVLNALWLSNANGSGSSNPVGDFLIKSLSMVVIILGILKFAQEAPNLIKDFFGDSGKFSLKSPKKQFNENKLAMGGLGAIGGMASAGVKNFNHARKNGKGFWETARSTIGGASSGLFRGGNAGYKSQNFKDLKYNTSAAVDRALQARDNRDIKQLYDSEHGFGAYTASSIKNSFEKWISGDSYASLTAKKAKLESLEGNYNKPIADVEKALEEKATRFKYDGISYYQYKQMQERAAKEYQSFDRQKFEDNYLASNKGATVEQARKASSAELEKLLKTANEQTQLLADVKKNLTDGIISSVNTIDGNFEKIHSFIDGDGREHSINIGDEMKGLKESIEKANNAFENNTGNLSTDLNKILGDSEKSVRAKRGALRSEMSELDAKIASLNELKQSDKK